MSKFCHWVLQENLVFHRLLRTAKKLNADNYCSSCIQLSSFLPLPCMNQLLEDKPSPACDRNVIMEDLERGKLWKAFSQNIYGPQEEPLTVMLEFNLTRGSYNTVGAVSATETRNTYNFKPSEWKYCRIKNFWRMKKKDIHQVLERKLVAPIPVYLGAFIQHLFFNFFSVWS